MLGKAGCTGALCWLEIVETVDWLLLQQHLTTGVFFRQKKIPAAGHCEDFSLLFNLPHEACSLQMLFQFRNIAPVWMMLLEPSNWLT